jgi:hypothetical protein
MDQAATYDPPGWNYNPSGWGDRLPITALSATGLGIALYLGLYQLHVLHRVWEPFFGDGSDMVLRHTPISRVLPDALVGAFFYFLDLTFSLIGGRDRWRSVPWAVLLQGINSVGLGFAGVGLAILQRVAFGHYCTLCLSSAACSVLMVGFALAEALATLQHLRRVRRRGGSVNEAVWGETRRGLSAPQGAPTA